MAQSKLAAAPRLGARSGVPLPAIGRAVLLVSLAILTMAAVVLAADGIVDGLSVLRAPRPAAPRPHLPAALSTAFLAPAGVTTLVGVAMSRSLVRRLTHQGAR